MKKSLLIIGVAALLITIGLSGCIDNNSALRNLGYSNTAYGFGLNPPDGWRVDETQSGAVVGFFGPEVDNLTLNILIAPVEFSPGETVKNTAEYVIGTGPDSYTNFSLVSSGARTVNGMNAYEFVATYISSYVQDAVVKAKEVIIEKNRKGLIAGYSAPENSFDVYDIVFEESLSSITIV